MAIKGISRLTLGSYPTPLEYSAGLSKLAGVEIWVKRDDLTGFALGGNKVRKCDYLLAHAQQLGCKGVVAAGGAGSNHLRVISTATKNVGLEAHLVMFGNDPGPVTGNYMMTRLMATSKHFTGSTVRPSVDNAALELHARLEAETNQKYYFIPRGGATARGSLGYVEFVDELSIQLSQQKIDADHIVLSVGSCGTGAGIWLGTHLYQAPFKIWGFSVSRDLEECQRETKRLALACAQEIGLNIPKLKDTLFLSDKFMGPAYGKADQNLKELIVQLISTTGLVFDPVFTGKAILGLLDLCQTGQIRKNEKVVFIHTGGHPSFFADPLEFANIKLK